MPKSSRKHKRSEKRDSRRKHRRGSSSESGSCESSSSRDSRSSDEWVEMRTDNHTSAPRDSWMSETSFVPTYTLKDLRKKQSEDRERKKEETTREATRVGRELNPYWRDGGSGLPKDYTDDGKPKLVSQTTGDQGVEWLKKALKRAQEQAKEENRSLESVAAERYGSLKNLYKMIDEAENRNRGAKRGWKDRHSTAHERTNRSPDRYHSRSSSSHSSSKFMKPSDDAREEKRERTRESTFQSRQGWRKPKKEESLVSEESEVSSMPDVTPAVDLAVIPDASENVILSDAEMNALAAKIVKAEIMGKKTVVEELKKKLENARQNRDSTKKKNSSAVDQVMILTSTNARGVTQPVRGKVDGKEEKKRRKYATHIDGERVRYFEDDEKYSLTEMFEKEQMTTSADVNAEFIRLSSKSKGDKDLAIDDMFMEQSTSNKSRKSDTLSVVDKQRNRDRTLDTCSRCLENNRLPKHLIISTTSKAYLALPEFNSLTENHCLIAPVHHATCSTLLDEDVWEEILNLCKKLVNIFREEDFDVVFFETASNFKGYPHMVIQCVPIPFEVSNLAPIYFKKAIMECEKEWAQNKKVVDIAKMNVRRAIPKGLPYFMVNFGLDNGFAHVIEDEKDFPRNFAQEIIGGMMDLDHSIWRKVRPDSFEKQCKKVNQFKKMWKP